MAKGNRLAGALKREPRYTTQPVKGNERTMRGAPPAQPLQRLSPGVYRGADGGLVNQRGAALQQQPNRQRSTPNSMPNSNPLTPQQLNEQFGTLIGNPQGSQGVQDGMLRVPEGRPMPNNLGSYDPNLNAGPMQNLNLQMPQGMPQMPQASANMGGQYRLSPGMYGNREQAMQQYNQQMGQMYQPMNGLGQQGNMPPMDWSSWGPMVAYAQRRG